MNWWKNTSQLKGKFMGSDIKDIAYDVERRAYTVTTAVGKDCYKAHTLDERAMKTFLEEISGENRSSYQPTSFNETEVLKERVRTLEERIIKMEEEFAGIVTNLVKELKKDG